ncbi:MAG TPA: Mut7-C RNAse domain-containing protein [Smithella sp.]|nr:Mut7-C RNAse domain-containing protein [Smithella sp.]MDM7986077.1 Mut7-C RNAse domain-containing protein [Smithella sp.]HNY49026.1 Mut7-C RNAse domain-containing protein [Smithella sp.]HOG90007.1 Mut7-C RNAse domain-containing protein [Smithella sp.]HOU51914.1 Mut7-C RNAse domain-containing protein [Smithella sp.]
MSSSPKNKFSSSSSEDLKFLTDASLARLAKWLRLLGYDTVVFPREAGREMLRLADKEGRIVLTRRQDMTERQFAGMLFLITDVVAGSQLKSVIENFSLKINRQKMFGICLECNEKLNPVSREEVRDMVPPYVFENCEKYNQCPSCHKIYWMGTHSRNALRFMERHIPNHLP